MSINRGYNTGGGLSFFTPRLIPCFSPFFGDMEIRVCDSRFNFRLIVNENGISICQNLSLGVADRKQIKFRKLRCRYCFMVC